MLKMADATTTTNFRGGVGVLARARRWKTTSRMADTVEETVIHVPA